jgi:phosphoadenosine phosphosulfate reductase
MTNEIEKTSVLAEKWSAEEVLRWTFSTYSGHVAVASAFGSEGIALIDMAARICPGVSIFTLDTQFLFPETYQLAAQIEERYNLRLQRLSPALTPEEQSAIYGPALWKRDPDLCCALRKIEPLERKLAELKAWITAIRRDQTPARAHARKVGWDHRFGLVKINPLADWTTEMVWDYIHTYHLPYNPLHDQNYPSIGCTHCTRPTTPDEKPRAGRWRGFHKMECGLHLPGPSASQVPRSPEFALARQAPDNSSS